MLVLHAQNPNEVSSNKMLDIFLGTPSNHLLIYTGIAMPHWDSQSSVDNEQVQINLGQPIARDGSSIKVTGLLAYTATVGLASIRSEEEDFIFATEDVNLSLTPGGELVLISNIVVQGEPAVLNRFSYQANVIVDIDEPLITGTIFWTPETARVAAMNRIDNLFTITAFIDLPPAPGTFSGGTKVVAVGEVTGALLEQARNITMGFPGRFLVPYVIRNVPLDTPLHVGVSIQPGAFSPQFPNTLSVVQVSGPHTITLTLTNLKQTNVNFELVANQMPH